MGTKKDPKKTTKSTAQKPSLTAPATAPSPAGAPAPAEKPPAAAYEAVLVRVLEHRGALKPCTANEDLVRANVRTSVAALQPFASRLADELPRIPASRAGEALDLASALVHARQLADGKDAPPRPANLKAKLARLHELRGLLLNQAALLARMGVLPGARVSAIRAGHGNLDAANDASALHSLYTEFAGPLTGKHPFSAEEISELGQLGHELSQYFRPTEAKKSARVGSDTVTPDEIVQRIWAVLGIVYLDLRKAGFYFFGEDFDDHVPPLQARLAAARTPDPTTPAPPAPKTPA
jgi:hypothetical protein